MPFTVTLTIAAFLIRDILRDEIRSVPVNSGKQYPNAAFTEHRKAEVTVFCKKKKKKMTSVLSSFNNRKMSLIQGMSMLTRTMIIPLNQPGI